MNDSDLVAWDFTWERHGAMSMDRGRQTVRLVVSSNISADDVLALAWSEVVRREELVGLREYVRQSWTLTRVEKSLPRQDELQR